MGDKNKNNKSKNKTGPKVNNDQLGENAYEPYSNNYDNKGRGNGKAGK